MEATLIFLFRENYLSLSREFSPCPEAFDYRCAARTIGRELCESPTSPMLHSLRSWNQKFEGRYPSCYPKRNSPLTLRATTVYN
jgi:hypothetical protein